MQLFFKRLPSSCCRLPPGAQRALRGLPGWVALPLAWPRGVSAQQPGGNASQQLQSANPGPATLPHSAVSLTPPPPAGIKRTQLKHTADASVSDKQSMDAQHADGSSVAVQVQGADRHGDGSRCGGRLAGRAILKVSVLACAPLMAG